MNKKIQPNLKPTKFKCASCGAEFVILSTNKADLVTLDVCSNCHPFYKGGLSDQKVKGRAEKLSKKFEAGKVTSTTKKTKTAKVRKTSNKKNAISLDQLNSVEK